MDVEGNRRLIQAYMAAFGSGNTQEFADYFSPDFVDRNAFPGQKAGPQGVIESFSIWQSSFTNLDLIIEDLVAEGDRVAVFTSMRAIHSGVFMDIPPTGKTVTVRGISIFRVANGRIVERDGLTDMLGLLRQLGKAI